LSEAFKAENQPMTFLTTTRAVDSARRLRRWHSCCRPRRTSKHTRLHKSVHEIMTIGCG